MGVREMSLSLLSERKSYALFRLSCCTSCALLRGISCTWPIPARVFPLLPVRSKALTEYMIERLLLRDRVGSVTELPQGDGDDTKIATDDAGGVDISGSPHELLEPPPPAAYSAASVSSVPDQGAGDVDGVISELFGTRTRNKAEADEAARYRMPTSVQKVRE